MALRNTFVTALQWRRFFPWSGSGRYFHLEIGSRYRWYLKPARTALIMLCVLVSLWIAASMVHAVNVFSDKRDMESRLDQIREQDRQLIASSQQDGIDLSASSLQRLPLEVGLANQLLAKQNFSWTQFLSGLEEAIPQRVSIKSVRLDPGSSLIHLNGAATSVEDVTALALKLQNHPVFRDPVLGQHHDGSDGLVEFDLSLKYHQQGT
ncbi:MAG TPA: PilN domain-containing protein [Nitrospira sp.]